MNKLESFISKLMAMVFVCLDASHPAWGVGRGILQHQLPKELMCGGSLPGQIWWMSGYGHSKVSPWI